MLGLRAIHHIALKVTDLEACARFYRDVLGLPFLQHQHDGTGAVRSVWLQLAPQSILMLERLAEPKPAGDTSGGWHLLALAITVEEREYLERRLPDAGVPITGRTAFTLYIADPEGNRLGLSHHPTPYSSAT